MSDFYDDEYIDSSQDDYDDDDRDYDDYQQEMQDANDEEEAANTNFILFGIASGFFKWLFG